MLRPLVCILNIVTIGKKGKEWPNITERKIHIMCRQIEHITNITGTTNNTKMTNITHNTSTINITNIMQITYTNILLSTQTRSIIIVKLQTLQISGKSCTKILHISHTSYTPHQVNAHYGQRSWRSGRAKVFFHSS